MVGSSFEIRLVDERVAMSISRQRRFGVRRQVSDFLGGINFTIGRGGGLFELEVQLQAIEPGDPGIDTLGGKFRRQVLVLGPKPLQF